MTERVLRIELSEILSVANCAESYGFDREVLMCALAEWACPVTDDEIRAYAETLVRTSIKLGKEDRDEAVKRLTEWRDKYEPSYRVQQAIERRREAGL